MCRHIHEVRSGIATSPLNLKLLPSRWLRLCSDLLEAVRKDDGAEDEESGALKLWGAISSDVHNSADQEKSLN